MTGINEYTAYFKNLAVQHTSLNHSDDVGESTFVRSNIWELNSGFRTKLKGDGFIMRLINPQWRLIDTNSDNPMKNMEGSFLILGRHSSTDFDKQQEAMNNCETIVEDIIARMRKDANEETRNEAALFNGAIKNLQGIQVYPQPEVEPNYSGWLVTFPLTPYFNPCVDNNKWKDLT